jgi:hypothetical protein
MTIMHLQAPARGSGPGRQIRLDGGCVAPKRNARRAALLFPQLELDLAAGHSVGGGLSCGSAPPRIGAALSGVPLNIVNAASADGSTVRPRRAPCVKRLSHKFVNFRIYVVFSSWPVADLRAEG